MESIPLSGIFNAFSWFLCDVTVWSKNLELASILSVKENVSLLLEKKKSNSGLAVKRKCCMKF